MLHVSRSARDISVEACVFTLAQFGVEMGVG